MSGLRQTVLQIINRVRVKLGLNTITDLSSSSAELYLGMVNEVLSEVSDAGDWQEMFREVSVTASSSVTEYEVQVSGLVKNIYEIAYSSDVAPLEVRDIQDIRRLQRISSTGGTPRQFAVVGVNASSGNPTFRIWPVPATAQASGRYFDVAYYQKPEILTTADSATTIQFPAELVFKGVYAKALLEENGGEPTQEYQAAYMEFVRERTETLNRFNADTGTDVYIVPGMGRW